MGLGQDHIPTWWSAGAPWGISDPPGRLGGSDPELAAPGKRRSGFAHLSVKCEPARVPAGEIMGVCRGFQR